MVNSLLEMISYGFMVRALVVGVAIAVCAALIGVPLVLRRNSMIGDGLSHVGFGAFAVASVLGLAPLAVALPVVILASFWLLKLGQHAKVRGEAAVALISTSALAIGTFIVSLSGSNVDINSYLFGSILSVGDAEVVVSILLSIVVIALFLWTYHRVFAITFDERFAKSIGVRTEAYNLLFAGLCSAVIVLGMRLMGSLLISSLMVFPVLTARQLAKSYRGVVMASVGVAVTAFLIGLIVSYLLGTPTGATIVIANLGMIILGSLWAKL